LPAASGGGERQVSVILNPSGSAALSTAFSGRPSRSLVLIAKDWDRAVWSEAGPGTLERREQP
jgi:hypothetical protein